MAKPDNQQPNRIRVLRKAKGLTMEELAYRVGCSQPMLSDLETGRRNLTQRWMQRIAPHLDSSAADLLWPDQNRSAEDRELDRLRDLAGMMEPVQRDALMRVAESMVGYRPQPRAEEEERAARRSG